MCIRDRKVDCAERGTLSILKSIVQVALEFSLYILRPTGFHDQRLENCTHLDNRAKPKVGESAKAKENTVIDSRPTTITGFLPMESVRCPNA